MREFVIESVVKTRPWINGVEAHLDVPSAETFATPRYGITLRGWIVCAAERIAGIGLFWHDKRIADAKISPRPDVEAVYPDNRHVVGFRIDVVPGMLAGSEPLRIVLETADLRSSTVFEITLRCTALVEAEPSEEITFVPILASARSGTTFLSQLLHGHEQVLGHREYPYEARLGIRLAEEWFANLQPRFYEPEGSRTSQSMDQNLLAMLEMMDETHTDKRKQLKQFFVTMRTHYHKRIVDLYRMVSSHPAGAVIVEKLGLQWDLDLVRGLFRRVRPIFIVRDPNDMLVSMRAFNARRGLYEFHEANGKNLGTLLPIMAGNLMHLVGRYDSYAGEKLLIRYEELIRDPAKVLRKAFEFVGVDSSEKTVARLLEQSRATDGHVTAPSQAASIGHSHAVLTPSEARRANWFFAPFARRFGYVAAD